MKILVVSLYYEPDRCQSNGPIIRAMCEDWAEAGHEVTVLTSFPHYNCDEVWPEYRGRLFQRDRVGGVNVIRSYIFVPSKRSGWQRILNYLSFNISSTFAGLFAGKQDVVFAMSPPLTIGLTAYVLGLLKRIPYCYNLQDIWPEVAVKLGMLRGRKLIAFFEAMEKFIYRHSRRIFAISDEFKANLIAKGVAADNIEVIPNFTDTDFIKPMEKVNAFSLANGLADKFNVLYAGNVGLSQGLEVILDAAEQLKDHSEIVFTIVGEGSSRDELIAESNRRGLQNVKLLPFQPESDVPMIYAAADIALIPLRHGITENSVPCKTYSIMAAAKPYIAGVDAGSTVWKLTDQVGCGVCVEPENGRALAEAVLKLQADADARNRMGVKGRQFVERNFAREAITDRYRVALENLVEKRSLPITGKASLSSE
jgi:colanic acid biosynthesis glycosyl transferase WcaI